MKLLKKLATSLLPRPILKWAKQHYYTYVVPRFWEPEVELIRYFVKPGDSALDLGANIGWYSSVLARLVGESGKVYAVEPIPDTFALLSTVVSRLGLKNINLYNCAVSDKTGTAVMEIPKHDYGGTNYYMAKIVSGNPSNPLLERFEVPLRSVDDLLPGAGAERVTFVKCDVEGHELAVLRGATQFFQRTKPAMMIEVSGTRETQDDPKNEFFAIMSRYGYTPYWVHGSKLRRRAIGDWSVNYFFLQPNYVQQCAEIIAG